MDAFAVSIAAGLAIERLTWRHVFRMSFHFGLFQFMMPVAGWLIGRQVADLVGAWDHWVAFALLGVIGGKMLWDARRGRGAGRRGDPTRGWTLLVLSVATSIDAFAVGLGMAVLGVSIWVPSIAIGLVAATMSAVGICFGGRFGSRGGRLADAVGGVVLIAIGVRILVEHLAGRA